MNLFILSRSSLSGTLRSVKLTFSGQDLNRSFFPYNGLSLESFKLLKSRPIPQYAARLNCSTASEKTPFSSQRYAKSLRNSMLFSLLHSFFINTSLSFSNCDISSDERSRRSTIWNPHRRLKTIARITGLLIFDLQAE